MPSAVALLDRAAHQAPQDVAAVLVGGHDAVGDQERHRARVVGQDRAARGRRGRRVASSRPSVISGTNWSVSKIESTPCWISAMRLRPRPVSMLLRRQRRQGVRSASWSYCMNTRFQYSRKRSFSPPGQVVGRAPVQAAVEVELRARAAGAGRPGLPEVVLAAELDDPLARDADRLPGADGLLVGPEAELLVAPKTVTQMSSSLEAERAGRELERELRPRPP